MTYINYITFTIYLQTYSYPCARNLGGYSIAAYSEPFTTNRPMARNWGAMRSTTKRPMRYDDIPMRNWREYCAPLMRYYSL